MDMFSVNICGAEYNVSESATEWIFTLSAAKLKAEFRFFKKDYKTIEDAIFEMKCMEEG